MLEVFLCPSSAQFCIITTVHNVLTTSLEPAAWESVLVPMTGAGLEQIVASLQEATVVI